MKVYEVSEVAYDGYWGVITLANELYADREWAIQVAIRWAEAYQDSYPNSKIVVVKDNVVASSEAHGKKITYDRVLLLRSDNTIAKEFHIREKEVKG